MKYKDMTKAELIEKLKEQEHLASAVDAKDEEIARYRKNLQAMKAQVDKREDESAELEQLKNAIKILEDNNKKVMTIAQEKVKSVSLYKTAFLSLLKSMQGTLDNTIELEALLSEKISK